MDFDDKVASPQEIESSIEPAPEDKKQDLLDDGRDHDALPDEDIGGEAKADKDQLKDGKSLGKDDSEDGGLHDLRATAVKGTKHRKANLAMGTQVAADGKRTGAPKPVHEGKVADATHVSLAATEASPIELAPGSTPAEADLFTRPATGGKVVTHRSGSTAAPNVSPVMQEDNLYIDGAPHVEDIRQGGLGDCFFQSCLLGVTQNDPAKIQSVMSIAGGEASVTLQRFDKKTASHVPVTVKTGTGLLTKKTKGKGVSLVGARMRIGDAPKKTAWWAEVHGKTVEVHRKDVYETSLWAPLMEKAYADFAQRFGSTGQGLDKDEKKLKSGYKIINAGGSVEECYQMFYGPAATSSVQDIAFDPTKNIVTQNIPAIQKLLNYEATRGNTAAGTTQGFMHARIGETGAASRGDALITQVLPLLFAEQLGQDFATAFGNPSVVEQIQALLRTINRNALRGLLNTLQTTCQQFVAGSVKVSAVAKAAAPLAVPDAFPHLWDDKMPAPFKQLRENILILLNLGDDSSPKQRMNYASHAYQVRSVVMADAAGTPLALGVGDLPARAAEIDPQKSQVLMHNPHATNEPDQKATGPSDGVDDGKFAYSLDQFLRNFDLLRMNDVVH